jgi:hypothetical protein
MSTEQNYTTNYPSAFNPSASDYFTSHCGIATSRGNDRERTNRRHPTNGNCANREGECRSTIKLDTTATTNGVSNQHVVRSLYTGICLKHAIRTLLCVAFITIGTSACRGGDTLSEAAVTPGPGTPSPSAEGYSLDSVMATLEGRVQSAQRVIAPHAEFLQKTTTDEVEKLFRWEYKVTELPKGTTASDLEQRLADLGLEGWECFDIYTVPYGSGPDGSGPNGTRITCKRRPRSALNYFKYVPGL